MAFLPGWNSLDDVSYWHNAFNVAGILVLALLVGTETIAQIYGYREAALTKAAEASRTAEQKKKDDEAEASRKAEIGGLKGQLTEAEKRVAELQKVQPQWRFTQEQKVALIAAMKPFPGTKILIGHISGDQHGSEVASDFVEIAKAAGWNDGGVTRQSVFTNDPIGIRINVNGAHQQSRTAPKGTGDFVAALYKLGLSPTGQLSLDNSLPMDTIGIEIGRKPVQ